MYVEFENISVHSQCFGNVPIIKTFRIGGNIGTAPPQFGNRMGSQFFFLNLKIPYEEFPVKMSHKLIPMKNNPRENLKIRDPQPRNSSQPKLIPEENQDTYDRFAQRVPAEESRAWR